MWDGKRVSFFSGGAKHENFVALFDEDSIATLFQELGHGDDCPITIYGEAYGGKMQGMRDSYGPDLKFIAFETKIADTWLNVPNAEDVAGKVGLDFVPYEEIECTLANLDAERDRESVIAIRNGMGPGKKREGIVIRPLEELRTSNGERLMAKHKSDAFRESHSPQPRPGDPAKQAAMKAVKHYVGEYVVMDRLQHVLDATGLAPEMQNMRNIIGAMVRDILEEEPPPEGMNMKAITKGIGNMTAGLLKAHLRSKMEKAGNG